MYIQINLLFNEEWQVIRGAYEYVVLLGVLAVPKVFVSRLLWEVYSYVYEPRKSILVILKMMKFNNFGQFINIFAPNDKIVSKFNARTVV